MPELLRLLETDFTKALYPKRHDFEWRTVTNVRNFTEDRHLEYVGKGASCIVVAIPGDTKRVVAFNHYPSTPQEMKLVFYTQRLLVTLFPHNLPRFYAAFSDNENDNILSGTIRQRIKRRFGERVPTDEYKRAVKYRFENVEKELRKIDLAIGFDDFEKNFDVGSDGGEYFLDTPYMPYFRAINRTKILEYMRTNRNPKYSKYEIHVVNKTIKRIAALEDTKYNVPSFA
jgi:hypothetical protein